MNDAEVQALKQWVYNRSAWIDKAIPALDNLMHKVTFVANGEVYQETLIRDEYYVSIPEKKPRKEGYVFVGWVDENGNLIDQTAQIFSDVTFTAKFVRDSKATHATDIAFHKASDIKKYNVNAHLYYTDRVFPSIAAKARSTAIRSGGAVRRTCPAPKASSLNPARR